MRTILAALGVGAALGVICCQGAAAMPVALLQQASAAASPVLQAQCSMWCPPGGYTERRTKHYIVKCYRDLAVGPYSCHRYRYR